MDNAVNFLMLVCAALAALAAGVMLGYMVCKALFYLCSLHARSLSHHRQSAKPHTASA